ncbi:helix-turn-helix domain-containing protein [Halomarina halobia]|uniref:Helix-turn-helix domain-containing protein n=1 Tax=Halomarina halobia TaxID=3033386 RepID=A0ABD6AGQ1_9EURY|nr:helix-turn-helix domain-containing protein [Halomarina sp. PSR21]
MQYATITYRHPNGWPQSLGNAFAAHDDMVPVALHSSHLLEDGTAVMLYELEGDPADVSEILSESQITMDYRVTQHRDCTIAYIHYNPTTTVKQLTRIPRRNGLIIDKPMMFHEDGGLEITFIGLRANIKQALEETPSILTTTIERIGEYEPSIQKLFTKLSDRQREILRTAHKLGYYQQPRETTCQEIASELDCTAANVGDVLRRIENSLIDEIVRTAFDTKYEDPPMRSVW